MLTNVYAGAFTHGLNGAAQGTGFGTCFDREQAGNEGAREAWISRAMIALQDKSDQSVNECQTACKPGSVQGVAAPG
jgi:hypothetical protein